MTLPRSHLSTALLAAASLPSVALASSHMDAPLITLDPSANTTDVYAFVTEDAAGNSYLNAALSVYPFEDPGVGPNRYVFDENVAYGIHIMTGSGLTSGLPSFSYYFRFRTRVKNRDTILQAYTGVVQNVDDAAQNLVQTYDVFELDYGSSRFRQLGTGTVPPNNQGLATPHYNQNNGDGPALDGVDRGQALDRYTSQGVEDLGNGFLSFAGQRDDGFYGDISAIFDLLNLRNPGKDSQKGFNVHTLALQIPTQAIGGDMQIAGVYAASYRQEVEIRFDNVEPLRLGNFVQVGRQGNPLFCEGFVANRDKDRYNRTRPQDDATLFSAYALQPELAALLNAIVFAGSPIAGIETNRTDLEGIFIPDLIRVDLSTGAVPLAGGGPNHASNPDDPGFSRLSVFGGDTVFSPLQQTMIPSGWPNGRRFGDDVVDIGVSAVISDLRVNPAVIRTAGDNVDGNDIAYNKVFPYAATPLNGRNHDHD